MKSQFNKLLVTFIAGISLPYFYITLIRPKAYELEKKIEEKFTSISDEEVKQMRAKLEANKEVIKNKS